LLPSFYANGTFGGAPPLEGQRRFITSPDQFAKLLEAAGRILSDVKDARLGIAPHSLRAVTPDSLSEVVSMLPDGPIHIHAAEQTKEVDDCVAWSGLRPVEWLLANHDVGPRWCLIHATHMTPDETAALAKSGAVAGLCPITEASLGDGIFDGVRYVGLGGRFGVGTDSNIEITAPGELKQLEYAQRLLTRSRNVLAQNEGESSGRRLYTSALEGGAQALQCKTGALAPRCRADFVVLDENHPDLAARMGDGWLDAFVFVAGRTAIRDVYLGGEQVVNDGKHHMHSEITRRFMSVRQSLYAA
jgi:formiminoglutamate deiminase